MFDGRQIIARETGRKGDLTRINEFFFKKYKRLQFMIIIHFSRLKTRYTLMSIHILQTPYILTDFFQRRTDILNKRRVVIYYYFPNTIVE